jgi:hypothetical protein
MERNVANSLFKITIIDRRLPVAFSASSNEPTPLEIQRWEDDGGAVLRDALRPRKRSLQHRAGDEQFHCKAA